MNEIKHDPEPWIIDENDCGPFYIDSSEGECIAKMAGRKGKIHGRRIVACVNACARIGDDELVPEAFANMKQREANLLTVLHIISQAPDSATMSSIRHIAEAVLGKYETDEKDAV